MGLTRPHPRLQFSYTLQPEMPPATLWGGAGERGAFLAESLFRSRVPRLSVFLFSNVLIAAAPGPCLLTATSGPLRFDFYRLFFFLEWVAFSHFFAIFLLDASIINGTW